LTSPRNICDYEGHDYRSRFWEQGREYEDLAERIAMRRLLPPRGQRVAEIGAGYGRLADLYGGFSQVVLVEPALSLLREAQTRLGRGSRYVYVRGNVQNLPLADRACDTMVIVRVLHHIPDVPRALSEMARALAGGGTFVCEYANKRNLKAILRYLLRRQPWNPFSPQPVEFAPLHFDFHPRWMAQQLSNTGLVKERALAVSIFRIAPLKRFVPPRLLASVDGLLQPAGSCSKLSPSVFLRATAPEDADGPLPTSPFRCPACHNVRLNETDQALVCGGCGKRWPIDDGIYDFGQPQRGTP
jgi:SAM-dependent methyltransferase